LIIALSTLAPAPTADAFVGTCARFLATVIGQPFVAGAAREAGSQTARYFAEKAKRGGQQVVESRDIDALKGMGVTECEISGFLGKPQAAPTFSAVSQCRETGASGFANHMPSAQIAQQTAVQNCILYGGIPACCAQGLRWQVD
jgi:hypothetical protein